MKMIMHNPFPTQVIEIILPEMKLENKKLEKLILEERKVDAGIKKSNLGGSWHSKTDIQLRKEQCFKKLVQSFKSCALAITQTLNTKFDTTKYNFCAAGWINVNTEGSFNAPHTHPNSTWSAVYYVKVPEFDDSNEGRIEFMDIGNSKDALNAKEALGVLARKRFKMNAKEGTMIMFPSHMLHWVLPHNSGNSRISIALNGEFVKKTKGQSA